MPLPLRLEDFAGPAPFQDARTESSATRERDGLARYEAGYAAGWEDAVRAAQADRTRVAEDLARALRDLSFTYVEARAALLQGLEPLLHCMVDRVLPDLARDTLGPAVLSHLMTAAGTVLDSPVQLIVSPSDLVAVETALAAAGVPAGMPVTLTPEPAQAPGQVHFRFADGSERDLDLPGLVSAIRGLVSDFLAETAAPPAHAQDRRNA